MEVGGEHCVDGMEQGPGMVEEQQGIGSLSESDEVVDEDFK